MICLLPILAGSNVFASIQTIDIVNDSEKLMKVSAHNTDGTLNIDQSVGAFSKSEITVRMLKIKSLQDHLFDAIINDSPEQIRFAIECGAMINRPIDGKMPLLWASLLGKNAAVRYLVLVGAIL